MGKEILGGKRTFQLGRDVKIEATPVYADENEDASPVAFQVEVWNRVASHSIEGAEIDKILAVFSGRRT